MRKKYSNLKFNWTFFGAVILMGALLFTIISKADSGTHMAYSEANKVLTDTGEDAEEEQKDTYRYRDDIYGYSIEIPVTWRQIMKDNTIYFIDQESSSSLKITGENYYPSVNSQTMELASQKVISEGNTFLNFTRISENHYEVIYQDKGNTTFDYMDEVFWDRSDILTLSCVFKDSEYEDVIDEYISIIDSFEWNTENSIPDGYCLYYCDIGAFEVCIPSSWTVSVGDGYVTASDTQDGITVTVVATEGVNSLEGMTSLDITNQLNQGQNGFILQTFSATKTEAYASARYLSGDQWMQMDEKLLTNGQYLYTITFQYPEGTLADEMKDTFFHKFRTFL